MDAGLSSWFSSHVVLFGAGCGTLKRRGGVFLEPDLCLITRFGSGHGTLHQYLCSLLPEKRSSCGKFENPQGHKENLHDIRVFHEPFNMNLASSFPKQPIRLRFSFATTNGGAIQFQAASIFTASDHTRSLVPVGGRRFARQRRTCTICCCRAVGVSTTRSWRSWCPCWRRRRGEEKTHLKSF